MNLNRTATLVATVVGAVITVAAVFVIVGRGADAADRTDASDIPRSPDTSHGEGLPDGEHVGRIIAAYVAPDEIVFRAAELLVGDEAAAAAEAEGAEAFGYYIREGTGGQLALPVDGKVAVTTVDCTAGCEEGAPTDYGSLTRTADGTSLHRLTIRDGAVVAIGAIYLP